jgi:hypothetical protein
MTDPDPELTPDTQALLAQVRRLQPAEGARERVLAGATRAIADGRRGAPRKVALLVGAPVLAAAAAAALLLPSPSPQPAQPPSARVLAADDAATSQGALRAGDGVGERAISVGERGRLQLALPRARAFVQGPARIELARGTLVVHEGSAEVDGLLQVHGAGCRATVNGRCAVSRTASQLQITVFAGSVQVQAPEVACSIVDVGERALAADVSRAPAAAAAPAPREPEPVTRSAQARPRPASPPPSELAQQVQAYREALALRGRDDARAIALFREMNRRWPRSPLRHEIDLNVVDALLRTGRSAEAAAEARRFLTRHPHSSKADEIRKSLGGTAPPVPPDRENTSAQ